MFFNNEFDGDIVIYRHIETPIYNINKTNSYINIGFPNQLDTKAKVNVNSFIDEQDDYKINFIFGNKRKKIFKDSNKSLKKSKSVSKNNHNDCAVSHCDANKDDKPIGLYGNFNLADINKLLHDNQFINKYQIIHKYSKKIEIKLNNYQINIIENPNYISVFISDRNENLIQIDDINFSVSYKNFYSIDLLIKEITNIIKFNYNINCYYYLKNVKQELENNNIFTKNIDGKLYTIIKINNIEIQFNLSFPYKHFGNRGPNYGESYNPKVLKASIVNIDLSSLNFMFELNYNTIFFRSVQQMISFFKYFSSNIFSNIYKNSQIFNFDEQFSDNVDDYNSEDDSDDLDDLEYLDYLKNLKF